jgi:hypothetical protein
MKDSFRVGRVQGISDLDADVEHRFDFKGLSSNQVPKSLSLEEFHRDEGSAICLINLVDRADMRVIQQRGGFSFALEAAQGLYVIG